MKILIIKLSSIGDIVHTLPALSLLKQLYPQAKIDWMLYRSFTSLLEGNEEINEIKAVEHRTFSSLFLKSLELKKENYDLVIDFQGLIKTGLFSFLISKKRLGFKEPREKIANYFYTDKADLGKALDNSRHVIEKNLELALAVKNIFKTETNKKFELRFSHMAPEVMFNENNETIEKVCIVPCTTWDSKFWTPENWASIIENLFEKHRAQVNILGSEKDLDRIKEIVSLLRKHQSIVFQLNGKQIEENSMAIYKLNIVTNKSLNHLPNFFRSMDLVMGVDTGPLHIASAACYMRGDILVDDNLKITKIANEKLNKKIIGLFGPSSGARSGPYGFDYLSADESLNLKVKNDRKNCSLMSAISVNEVLDLMQRGDDVTM